MAGRGQLTDEIQEKANAFLGRNITQTELRLYPYLQFTAVNSRSIDPLKVNEEERAIMRQLKEEGHGQFGINTFTMTREFWDYMNDLLWHGYFAFD